MSSLQDLFAEASGDTGIVVDWDKTIQPALDTDRVIVQRDVHGSPVGFLLWVEVSDPDTQEVMWIERMLWVRPGARGGIHAARILARWERKAEAVGYPVTLIAGASLKNPDIARRLYAGSGFQVTYGFKKRIYTCVTPQQSSA